MKKELIEFIQDGLKFQIKDMGIFTNEAADYPDIAQTVCSEVLKNKGIGILICGTGIGISISANKIAGIRCALCSEEFSARMARLHNDANVIALGGRTLGPELAKSVVNAFLTTEFSNAERHEKRVKKISEIESQNNSSNYPLGEEYPFKSNC